MKYNLLRYRWHNTSGVTGTLLCGLINMLYFSFIDRFTAMLSPCHIHTSFGTASIQLRKEILLIRSYYICKTVLTFSFNANGTNRNKRFSVFSGRIGNTVLCCRYGKYDLRALPDKVNHPKTEKQMEQRMRFALIQQFLQLMLYPYFRPTNV